MSSVKSGVLCCSSSEGNLHPCRPPREYLREYTSRGKLKIPLVDEILMDPGHKARKYPSDNADLDVSHRSSCAYYVAQHRLSAVKYIILSLVENHHNDIICLQETHVSDDKLGINAYEKKKCSCA